jgi:hypothetical protein
VILDLRGAKQAGLQTQHMSLARVLWNPRLQGYSKCRLVLVHGTAQPQPLTSTDRTCLT